MQSFNFTQSTLYTDLVSEKILRKNVESFITFRDIFTTEFTGVYAMFEVAFLRLGWPLIRRFMVNLHKSASYMVQILQIA